MLLYLIRHGDPDYATDSLTERGKLQAEAVGKRMAKMKIDKVFSSPLGRAKETAEPACRLLGIDCNIEDWTAEIGDKGVAEYVETGKNDDVENIIAQGDAFLEKLGYKKENGRYRILWENEERVAVFCHANILRTWAATLLKVQPVNIMLGRFDYNHTGVTVLEFKNNPDGITVARCLCYSDVAHLHTENLDLLYNGRIEV